MIGLHVVMMLVLPIQVVLLPLTERASADLFERVAKVHWVGAGDISYGGIG